jgi:rhodanese-related sulfurtransferase
MDTVTREFLKTCIENGTPIKLVDTLPLEQFQDSHLPGAISLPAGNIIDSAPGVLLNKDAQIIIYGTREKFEDLQHAAEMLHNLGYTNISAYKAGKEDWIDAGLPVEGGASARDGINLAQNAG